MELTTALIWTLRIVLPIILFCIYFKLQSPKEELSLAGATDNKNKYARNQLLTHRKASLAEGSVPAELRNIALKDESQAPTLFQGGGGGRSGGKGDGRGARREDKGDRAPRDRDRGDRREKREPRDPREPREAKELKRPKDGGEIELETAAAAPTSIATPQLSASEEKMHLESLLNYVAFNRKEQQRTFMVDEELAPPPPPKSAQLDVPLGGSAATVLNISGATAEKANAEAQMVLRGAINFRRSDVAKDIYEHLVASNVEILEPTFTLIIEASVLANDLKSASDFLMKMETAGHSPSSVLLDKVMDLYSQQKSQREKEKLLEASQVEEAADMVRAKLKSDAAIFVPSFGIPPPPPKPKPIDESAQTAAASEVKATEPTARAAEPKAEAAPRTKLTSSAKPFEPFTATSYGFDPLLNRSNWGTGEDFPAQQDREKPANGSKGKGGKDGKDGKGKPHANGNENGGKDNGKGRGKNGSAKPGMDSADTAQHAPAVKKGSGGDGPKTWKPKDS